MKIEPTTGRVVLYFPSELDIKRGMVQYGEKPMDAHIVFVWSDYTVNLAVFDHAGNLFQRASVPINVETGSINPSPRAEWMPYQVGQAKKHEPAGLGDLAAERKREAAALGPIAGARAE